MIKICLFTICFLTLIPNIQSQNERWIWFASDEIGNMYYDSESLKGESTDYPVVWVKTVYIKEEFYNGKRIDYELNKMQFFCKDRQYNFLGSYYYYVYDTTPDSAPNPGKSGSVIPGTIAEALFNKLCIK